MEQDKLKQDLIAYAANRTKLTAEVDGVDTIFTVLYVGEEGAYVDVIGEGETQFNYHELSHSRLREYSKVSEFVEQSVLDCTLKLWQDQGKEFEMDIISDVDLGWFLKMVKDGKIVGISMGGG